MARREEDRELEELLTKPGALTQQESEVAGAATREKPGAQSGAESLAGDIETATDPNEEEQKPRR